MNIFLLSILFLLAPHILHGQVNKLIETEINALADAYVDDYFQRFPEVATIRGIQNADRGSIRDPSPEAVARWQNFIDSLYSRLQLLEVPEITGSDSWVTYGYLRQQLETEIQTRVCREELWKVDQINGWQAGISGLAGIQPVGTDSLRKAALQRFKSLPKYVATHIENLREGLRLGYSSPQNNVKRVIEQLDLLLEYSPEQSPLFDPARRDSTPAFRKAIARLIREDINPSIKRYRDFLRNEYLPEARTETALSANPNGADCYRALLRKHTTLDAIPEDIHRLGLQMIEKLRDEIDAITETIAHAPDFFSSQADLIEAAEASVDRARAEMPRWFGTLPKADVVVVSMPSYLNASGPEGRYISGSADGSRKAQFLINPNLSRSRASLEKLAYHEAIPGHHLQRAIALERDGAHLITRYFSYDAFNEGWARYAELLADEMGLYSSDRARLIILNSQLESAYYLVLDTGLHYKGWTRQQAINFLLKQTSGNVKNIERMIDSIIIAPGQTTSYMSGYQEIRRLRIMAETELGDKFDLAQFHDLVLSDGSITLPMLNEKIKCWISSY